MLPATPRMIYRFRHLTAPERRSFTGPHGHAGQFKELRLVSSPTYSQSHSALVHYDPSQIDPILFGTVVNNVTAVLGRARHPAQGRGDLRTRWSTA